MRKLWLTILLLSIPGVAHADNLKTVFNPFTGKFDFIHRLSSMSIYDLTGISTNTQLDGICIKWSSNAVDGVHFTTTSCGGSDAGFALFVTSAQAGIQSWLLDKDTQAAKDAFNTLFFATFTAGGGGGSSGLPLAEGASNYWTLNSTGAYIPATNSTASITSLIVGQSTITLAPLTVFLPNGTTIPLFVVYTGTTPRFTITQGTATYGVDIQMGIGKIIKISTGNSALTAGIQVDKLNGISGAVGTGGGLSFYAGNVNVLNLTASGVNVAGGQLTNSNSGTLSAVQMGWTSNTGFNRTTGGTPESLITVVGSVMRQHQTTSSNTFTTSIGIVSNAQPSIDTSTNSLTIRPAWGLSTASTFTFSNTSMTVPVPVVMSTTSFVPNMNAGIGVIFSSPVAGVAEVFVGDGNGNFTQISAHDPNGAYIVNAHNDRTGRTQIIALEEFIKDYELRFGKKFIYESRDEYEKDYPVIPGAIPYIAQPNPTPIAVPLEPVIEAPIEP